MGRLKEEKKQGLLDANADWMAASKNQSGKGMANVNYWVKGIPPKDPNRQKIGEDFYTELIKAVDMVSKKYGIPVKDVTVQIDKKAYEAQSAG